MSDDTLLAFMRTAKDKGVPDDTVVALLRQRGWQEQQIYQALGEYYAQALGVPIPLRGSRVENARDAFLYLIAFMTLGLWMVGLIVLGDTLVDRFVRDPLSTYVYDRGTIAYELASIIIAYPIYLWVNALIAREIARRPEALDSGVRKWLTYIALVVTALVLVGTAVTVLAEFLSGSLSERFALKAGLLAVVTGGVFWYYLATVRPAVTKPWQNRAFGWGATAAIVAALIAGFVPLGTPATERALRVDQRRIGDLYQIATALHAMQNAKGTSALPARLADVGALSQTYLADPITKTPYDYRIVKAPTYQLCATFDDSNGNQAPPEWTHPAGRYCFTFNARRAPPEVAASS